MQLNLDPVQVKQAETQKSSADSAVTSRLPEAYQWLMMLVQATPPLNRNAGPPWLIFFPGEFLRKIGQFSCSVNINVFIGIDLGVFGKEDIFAT